LGWLAGLRLKLLALLEAGCDPNAVDGKGDAPSVYAQREGLWPQWAWALDQTGWRYDAATGKCGKKITVVEEEDVGYEEIEGWESFLNLPENDLEIGML
jgi:hypothetical protein